MIFSADNFIAVIIIVLYKLYFNTFLTFSFLNLCDWWWFYTVVDYLQTIGNHTPNKRLIHVGRVFFLFDKFNFNAMSSCTPNMHLHAKRRNSESFQILLLNGPFTIYEYIEFIVELFVINIFDDVDFSFFQRKWLTNHCEYFQ